MCIRDRPTPFTGMAFRALATSAIMKGDVNMDGAVDLLDVSLFVSLLTSGDFIPEADINCDGSVDLLDVAPFVSLLSGG